MTLVIANPNESNFFIYADTRLTTVKRKGLEREDNEFNSIPGILKLFIIDADFCLCYAGVYTNALKTLREINTSNTKSKANYCKIIEKNHKQSYAQTMNEGTDFMLCSRVDSSCTIWRNGSVGLVTSDNCYIGDGDAYNAIDVDSMNRRSIHDLVANEDFPSVGGTILSAYNDGSKFRYCSMIRVYFQNQLDADSSRNFQLTTVPSAHSEPRLGIFIADQQFGYLYDPIEVDMPMKIEACTLSEFQEQVNLKNGGGITISEIDPKAQT